MVMAGPKAFAVQGYAERQAFFEASGELPALQGDEGREFPLCRFPRIASDHRPSQSGRCPRRRAHRMTSKIGP
jgi:hypothetical protein